MASSMHTILIIGGTTGIGLACAQRFRSMGKEVIITGRPGTDRLAKIQDTVPGAKSYGLDVTDLASLPSHVEKVFEQFPAIDTVWVNAGILDISSIADLNSSTDAKVIAEITTNITAPFILARHIIPRLLALEDEHGGKKEANFLLTGSGLGFVPNGKLFPVYCPTKAAIHAYAVGIRQALADTNVNVIEIVPPLVEQTSLGPENMREVISKVKAMTLQEYVDETFAALEAMPARELKEVAAGSAVGRVGAWRDGVGEMLARSGLGG